MTRTSKALKQGNTEELKELRLVRKLLMLLLLKAGATSEEINRAVNMGAPNIREMFPAVKKRLLVELTRNTGAGIRRKKRIPHR